MLTNLCSCVTCIRKLFITRKECFVYYFRNGQKKELPERIDINMMNISIPDLHDLPKKMFNDKIQKLQKKRS